ncbi:MAG: PD-(D/E)XK nuclease family protein, partial [Acetomicrobium sp.]
MIHTYRFATELEEPLKEIHHEHKDLIFIVPSKEDKNLLLETLSIEGLAHDFPAIWRWGDLYGGLADILRRLGIRPPIKRQLDPPDHWLVVRHLVQNALRTSKELIDAIPAIRQPGFIETIGKQLHELIGEDVLQEDLAMALSCKNHEGICTCDDKCPKLIKPTGFLCNIYGKYLSY